MAISIDKATSFVTSAAAGAADKISAAMEAHQGFMPEKIGFTGGFDKIANTSDSFVNSNEKLKHLRDKEIKFVNAFLGVKDNISDFVARIFKH